MMETVITHATTTAVLVPDVTRWVVRNNSDRTIEVYSRRWPMVKLAPSESLEYRNGKLA